MTGVKAMLLTQQYIEVNLSGRPDWLPRFYFSIRIYDLTRRQNSKAKAFALVAAKVALDRHCSEIVVLDLRDISPAADYFVIATGTSNRQMRTVADEISEAAREQDMQRFGRAGYEQARWILLDFVDVVIHIFDSECRDYYDLELLWGDAKRLTIDN